MEINLIKIETDYNVALSRIDVLMDAKLGSPEGDVLDVLVTLVEKYEAGHYQMLKQPL